MAGRHELVRQGEGRGAEGGRGVPGLPLSGVVLYTSGVGYFERDGQVEGDTQVELRFKTEDINDLLKSLVVQDFSGGIGLDRHLRLARPDRQDPEELRHRPDEQPRPRRLCSTRSAASRSSWPAPGTARRHACSSVETKKKAIGERQGRWTIEYLNLLTDEGCARSRSSQVQRVKLLDPRLDAELRQALAVLATGHDTEKKTVALELRAARASGRSASATSRTPIWKTSYRLVLDRQGASRSCKAGRSSRTRPNEDWNDVKLTLVSGRPISFVMDLYDPLYVQRPVVEPELFASLRPQIYGQAMEGARATGAGMRE